MRYLAILLLLTSCAFKGGDDAATSSSSASAELGRTVTISWDGENSASVKRSVQGSNNYYLNDPVTIPDVAPTKLGSLFRFPY